MSDFQRVLLALLEGLEVGLKVCFVANERPRGDTPFNAQMPKKRFEQLVIVWN